MDQSVDAFRISLRHPVPGTSEMTHKAVLVVAQHELDVLLEARERGLEINGFIELQSR